MAQREEQIKVGAVVVIAAVVFLMALIFVGGVRLFRRGRVTYTSFFKFAGGLEPGSVVRFGGLKVGSVKEAELDPMDTTRIRVVLLVDERTPIRADSRARISTLGFLGENYVEISPGSREAGRLRPGSEIPVNEITQLADVFSNVNNVTLNANKLVNDFDEKFLVLANRTDQLITNVNAVVGPENRAHLEAVLANLDATLNETRPKLKTTLANFESASEKLGPTIDSARATLDKGNRMVGHVDEAVQEDRQGFHDSLQRLISTLDSTRQVMLSLDDTLNSNRADLDESIANFRETSENLKRFTDTIKQKPYSLIRIKAQKEHVPPNGK
jgi:phospholipid/cholesterol/gamma-HCH transport system substrate-binding protein